MAGGITAAGVAAAMAATSAVVTTVGVISAGQDAAAQGKYKQQVANQDAEIERRKGVRATENARINEKEFRREASRDLARQFAEGGASGVIRSEGSPLAVFSDFGRDTELQALRIRNSGAMDADAFNNNALNFQTQGVLDRAAGESAKRSSYFQAGATLASGFSDAATFGDKTSSFKPKGGAKKSGF
jgi:hypothetical protein